MVRLILKQINHATHVCSSIDDWSVQQRASIRCINNLKEMQIASEIHPEFLSSNFVLSLSCLVLSLLCVSDCHAFPTLCEVFLLPLHNGFQRVEPDLRAQHPIREVISTCIIR